MNRDKQIKFSMLMILAFAFLGCAEVNSVVKEFTQSHRNVIVIQRDGLEIGIWPEAGGRAVTFKREGSPNILDNTVLSTEYQLPMPEADTPWQNLKGHIVWVGPQSDFWSQQNVNPRANVRKAIWPPDPFSELGRYIVIDQDSAFVELRGPVSPVTGLQLTKRYELLSGQKARLTVTAKNMRNQPVSWGLWSNTRVHTDAIAYVHLDSLNAVRYEQNSKSVEFDQAAHAFRIEGDEIFTIPSYERDRDNKGLATKAQISMRDAVIHAVIGAWIFTKQRITPTNAIHPQHSDIEIYVDNHMESPILELEMHGDYQLIDPRESIQWSEEWQLTER
ncbi:DUF4380 domain-containing protein [Poriferisphaera sp. WC338]|uniref:DUF4380 domain-containing protein n=1 Tax=Poriferisphaera sp. WC338 TaxID=3425129 RepID=UPI003D813922